MGWLRPSGRLPRELRVVRLWPAAVVMCWENSRLLISMQVHQTAHNQTKPVTTAPVKFVKRDPFFDSWRGIFHIVMLIDHLPFVLPGTFTVIAGFYEALGYFTVAEGFVFLSGFVSGLVYTRTGREKGDRAMWRKVMIRAGEIYFCYVLAVIALLALVKCTGLSCIEWLAWRPLLDLSLPVASAKVAMLLYQPLFLEILPMYSLFLLVTPIILKQLNRGNRVAVIIISGFVWGAAQFGIREVLLKLLSSRVDIVAGYFNSFGWQIIFVTGLLCGHKTYTVKTNWLPTGWKLPVLASIVISVCFVLRHSSCGIDLEETLASRQSIGLLRLINFLCVVFLICKARGLIEKYIAWRGLAFLSKNSLQVFAFHLFPIYLATIAFGGLTTLPIYLQLLFIAICIGSLFLIAFLAQLFKDFRSRFKPNGKTVPSSKHISRRRNI